MKINDENLNTVLDRINKDKENGNKMDSEILFDMIKSDKINIAFYAHMVDFLEKTPVNEMENLLNKKYFSLEDLKRANSLWIPVDTETTLWIARK